MNTAAPMTDMERVARAVERQNHLGRRFISGLIFGVGSAIGASVIGALAVYLIIRLLSGIGWQEKLQEQIQGATSSFIEEQKSAFFR